MYNELIKRNINLFVDGVINAVQDNTWYWEGVCDTAISRTLAKLWEEDEELDVRSTQDYKNGTPEKFWAAKFCICPGGSSYCITKAIHYGCVIGNLRYSTCIVIFRAY